MSIIARGGRVTSNASAISTAFREKSRVSHLVRRLVVMRSEARRKKSVDGVRSRNKIVIINCLHTFPVFLLKWNIYSICARLINDKMELICCMNFKMIYVIWSLTKTVI